MFCFGIIPSDLIRSIAVLLHGRNAGLDLLGECVTILLHRNNVVMVVHNFLRGCKGGFDEGFQDLSF